MTRGRTLSVLAMTLVLTVAFVCAAVAQPPGGRRGFGFGRMGSLTGLLRMEQVQQELKLTDEQKTKVTEMSETLGGEMREQFAAVREIQDEEGRRAKMTELMSEFDRKTREQLRDVLERDQMMRLFQIRMQVRPVADSLSNEWLANRLQLTDDQKEKLTQLSQETTTKQRELFAAMRDASDDERTEALQKFRDLRIGADEKALAVLNDEQKQSFTEMQGEKFELQMRRGQ